jgi:hypothetical protein
MKTGSSDLNTQMPGELNEQVQLLFGISKTHLFSQLSPRALKMAGKVSYEVCLLRVLLNYIHLWFTDGLDGYMRSSDLTVSKYSMIPTFINISSLGNFLE